jgi:hypothetical protein
MHSMKCRHMCEHAVLRPPHLLLLRLTCACCLPVTPPCWANAQHVSPLCLVTFNFLRMCWTAAGCTCHASCAAAYTTKYRWPLTCNRWHAAASAKNAVLCSTHLLLPRLTCACCLPLTPPCWVSTAAASLAWCHPGRGCCCSWTCGTQHAKSFAQRVIFCSSIQALQSTWGVTPSLADSHGAGGEDSHLQQAAADVHAAHIQAPTQAVKTPVNTHAAALVPLALNVQARLAPYNHTKTNHWQTCSTTSKHCATPPLSKRLSSPLPLTHQFT